MIEDALLTPVQVAERLQLQERTVTRWLRTGYLPWVQDGQRMAGVL